MTENEARIAAQIEAEKIIRLSRKFAQMVVREFPETSEFDMREQICRCLCRELFDTRTHWKDVYADLFTAQEISDLT